MSRHAVPAAILLGACLVAAAVYFGLRQHSAVPVAAAPLARKATTEQVAAQVEAALDAQRARFVASCWVPSAAKSAEPSRSPYSFNLTIDADGNEITRGLVELRGQSRADVAQCLRDITDAPVKIYPPGQSTMVSVTIWLPQ